MAAWDDAVRAVHGLPADDCWGDDWLQPDEDWLQHCREAARTVGCDTPHRSRLCEPARNWRSTVDWEARVKLLRPREFQWYYRCVRPAVRPAQSADLSSPRSASEPGHGPWLCGA